jgi:hypothetical protein
MKSTSASLRRVVTLYMLFGLTLRTIAQLNSGSDGSDGAFNPTVSTVIDMADHPDGIYQYTSVIIPSGVTISFIPNANNSPVVWLVQSNCVINGSITVDGGTPSGGPGGYRGGAAGGAGALAGDGLGPGGGAASSNSAGCNASFGTEGATNGTRIHQPSAGSTYGNEYILPLVGGSGGGGRGFSSDGSVGGGGGGAILIAVSGLLQINGSISSTGSDGDKANASSVGAGGGSGGAIRLVATRVAGAGTLTTVGGSTRYYSSSSGIGESTRAGYGRIRIDALDDAFAGSISGPITHGYQPVIIPPPSQAVSLAIQSVAGIAVASAPTGSLVVPDVVVPGGQLNPISIVVQCINIPLNTQITLDVKPARGQTIRAVGVNNSGSQSSSTATIQITMPRGGGTIQAQATSGLLLASMPMQVPTKSYANTGLTAGGERFGAVEVTATFGGRQQVIYLTESGKRHTPSPL